MNEHDPPKAPDRRAKPAEPVAILRIQVLSAVAALLLIALLFTIVSGANPKGCRPFGKTLPVAVPSALSQTNGILSLTVLDVGQGDALLLQSPAGKTMLVDAGESTAFDTVSNALDAYGIHRIDTVVATHPHTDHIGGMAKLLQSYEVGAFYLTEYPSTTTQYAEMLRALKENGCSVRLADSDLKLDWDPAVDTDVLFPLSDQAAIDANNHSIVLRVTYGDVSFLLTGDLEKAGEVMLLAAYDDETLHADVLKVGHHGSDSSTSDALLDAVGASIAIVSVGKNNEYGHPHEAVLDRLRAHAVRVYRTDQSGTVVVMTDGEKTEVITQY